MFRTSVGHVSLAIALGFVAGLCLLAVVAVLNGGSGFAFCTASTPLGWLVPLISGLAIGGVALALLDSSGRHRDVSSPPSESTTCASCSSPIGEEWRLCPHCGSLLECDVASPLSDLAD